MLLSNKQCSIYVHDKNRLLPAGQGKATSTVHSFESTDMYDVYGL